MSERQTNNAAERILLELTRLGKDGQANKAEIKAYWDSTETERDRFIPTLMGSYIYTVYDKVMGLKD